MKRQVFALICFAGFMFAASMLAGQETDSGSSKSRLSQHDLLRGLMVTPKVIRSAATKIEPSLVTIESFGGVSTRQGQIGGIRNQGEGNTTGVIISEDGYVITSLFNFIRQPSKITVKTSNGTRHVADVMGRDATRNICVLKIEGVNNLPVPEFVPPGEVQVGQWAVSVGVGFGDENTALSIGIISAKNRIGGRAIQTDANISPANYGGPLIDIEGRMIGVCVPLSPGSTTAGAGVEWYDSGIGFAVPLHGNESLIERLKKGESIEPAYIGIQPTFDAGVAGAKVDSVIKDSPAKKAKIKKGDLITKIDDHEILDQASMRQILNRYSAGDKVTLTILRSVSANKEEEEEVDSDDEQAAGEGGDEKQTDDAENNVGDVEKRDEKTDDDMKKADSSDEANESENKDESGDSDTGESEAGDSEAGDSEAGDSEAGDSEAGDSEAGEKKAESTETQEPLEQPESDEKIELKVEVELGKRPAAEPASSDTGKKKTRKKKN